MGGPACARVNTGMYAHSSVPIALNYKHNNQGRLCPGTRIGHRKKLNVTFPTNRFCQLLPEHPPRRLSRRCTAFSWLSRTFTTCAHLTRARTAPLAFHPRRFDSMASQGQQSASPEGLADAVFGCLQQFTVAGGTSASSVNDTMERVFGLLAVRTSIPITSPLARCVWCNTLTRSDSGCRRW